jgi:NTE family protein
MDGKRADLVLEGAGVKGIGLVGAVSTLAEAGYRFPHVGGTSAGAVVGAYVVALQHAGEPLSRLEDIARSLNYAKMRDRGVLGRAAGPLARVVDGLSLAFDGGVFEGDYLRAWVAGSLADLGVRTFGDLRVVDEDSSLPADQRYSLVVMASDVSGKRLVRWPWDYRLYGLDPDEQSVADAVRASASIPFFFEPVTLRSRDESGSPVVSTMVDGSVLSNFPIAMFDRADALPPRWPTFGVRLSMRPEGRVSTHEVRGTVSLALSLVETMLEACDAQHIDDPCVQARSVFVDTSGVSPVDFGISEEQQELLLATGREATVGFLEDWDFAGYLRSCRGFEQAHGFEEAP